MGKGLVSFKDRGEKRPEDDESTTRRGRCSWETEVEGGKDERRETGIRPYKHPYICTVRES